MVYLPPSVLWLHNRATRARESAKRKRGKRVIVNTGKITLYIKKTKWSDMQTNFFTQAVKTLKYPFISSHSVCDLTCYITALHTHASTAQRLPDTRAVSPYQNKLPFKTACEGYTVAHVVAKPLHRQAAQPGFETQPQTSLPKPSGPEICSDVLNCVNYDGPPNDTLTDISLICTPKSQRRGVAVSCKTSAHLHNMKSPLCYANVSGALKHCQWRCNIWTRLPQKST